MPHQTPDRPPALSDASGALDSSSDASRPLVVRAAETFAFSSGLAAAIGGSLSLVASRLLNAPDSASWAFLSASGAFIIYSLDRLRDIDRDRETSPLRTAFVLRNRTPLWAIVGVAAIGFVATLRTAPPAIILLCMAIGSIGLFHRRMKGVAALKAAYVSLAWVVACVGMPWLVSGRESSGPWIAAILLASLIANLIASDLRDEGRGVRGRAVHADATPRLWIARAMTVLAVGITMAAPTPLRALIWIPACEGLVLANFRPTERYGQIAVDGGLLLGALVTSIHLGWATST